MPRSSRDSDDDIGNEDLPEDYFEVESIVDGRCHRGRWRFLVKWVGYTDKDNSWVTETDFGDNCLDMIREFKRDRQQAKKAAPAKPDKTTTAPISRTKRSRPSASSSSSNELTESLSDDNVPLGNRLRSRRSPASSLVTYTETSAPKKVLVATPAMPPAPAPAEGNEPALTRMDSETSANSNQTELITDDDHSDTPAPGDAVLAPAAAPGEEPVSTTADMVVDAVAEPEPVVAVVVPAPAPAVADRTGPVTPPPADEQCAGEVRDPNADLLCGSVFCRELVPGERFPKSVSEICSMLGTLDERGRIELVDHLTFRIGYAEMFALISTQRPFLSVFEKWLLEAYRNGSRLDIAFIRSALTLMSVFPGNKNANYKRLIKVIREWFVVDPVCMNLAERVLKQWQYHKEISQGKTSTSRLPSPVVNVSPPNRQANEVLSPPIPIPVRTTPPEPVAQSRATPPPVVPVAAVEPSPLPPASSSEPAAAAVEVEAGFLELDEEEMLPPAGDVAGSDSVAAESDTAQPGAVAESTLNQVEVEQDHTITYMPAGLDDDLDHTVDDGMDWTTVSIY